MHILKVGINYKTAPVEVREKLSFSEQSLYEAMTELKSRKSILENVIISTCNRMEVYTVVDQLHTGRYYIKTFLSEWFQIDSKEFSSYIHISENEDAMEHLFRVTTGLDSMVLGETQILGQVRDSFLHAQNLKTTGTIFNKLFKQAITFAKKVHNETAIGEHAVSISYTAVELAKQKSSGTITNKSVTLLGAGNMGALAAKNVHASGAEKITILNRTFSKAEELAETFNGEAQPIENLLSVLQATDILISSTNAPDILLTKEMLLSVLENRAGKPMILIDIAVPRDIDSSINTLKDVYLYDIDDLRNIVDENIESRRKAAAEAEGMLQHEISSFNEWLQTLGVVPIIAALRQKAIDIQTETMISIERKIPDLTQREKKVISKHTKSIINQLLKEPITQAKELAGTEHAKDRLQLFIDIFGINEEVKAQFESKMKENKTTISSKRSGKSPVSSI